MTSENQDRPTGDSAQSTPEALGAVGASRRRLAGLGASGVVMTLASQSAMAAAMCRAPSGALSGNLVSKKPAGQVCNGCNPEYWSCLSSWTGTGVSRTQYFRDYFNVTGLQGFGSIRCADVLESSLHSCMGMYMMSTYLNIASGKISFLTTDKLVSMWNEWRRNGTFVPAAGAKPWNTADILLYLKSIAS